jgi:hypothetical protein
MGLWLRTDLKPFLYDLLSNDGIKAIGYLNAKEVETIIAEHVKGWANHENKLWGLMNLVSWHRQQRP